MCQVQKWHEIAVYIHVVIYLDTRVRVENARPLKERPLPMTDVFS